MVNTNVSAGPKWRVGVYLKVVARIAIALLVLYDAAHLVWRASGSNRFEPALDQNGVKVFTMKARGADIRVVKGVARVRSTMAGLVAFLLNACEEYGGCSNDRDMLFVDRQLRYGAYEQATPFPFRRRELGVRTDIHQNPQTGKLWIEYSAVPEIVPPSNCCVRVTHMTDSIVLTPVGNGVIEIEYLLNMDMGGFLPDLFFNRQTPKVVYEILRRMQPRVSDAKYQRLKDDFIIEK
jgi:hypothetical protein